jgi:N-acyl-D-amino-acid deacylase
MYKGIRFANVPRTTGLFIICLLTAVVQAPSQQNEMYDLVITGGRVLDGTGEQLHAADIAIQNGKIVEVGYIQREGKRTIDARGYWVTPGFIDMGSRNGVNWLRGESGVGDLYQGITLAVIGDATAEGESAGGAAAAQTPNKNLAAGFCKSMRDNLDSLQKSGIALNIAYYVSAGHVRDCVMGRENRRPNQAELQEMIQIVAQSMQEGAFGLRVDASPPSAGGYFSYEDMAELAKAAGVHGGLFSVRLSASGSNRLSNLQECLRIAEEAKTGIQIENLGSLPDVSAKELIEVLTNAKKKGEDLDASLSLSSSLSKRSEEDTAQLIKLPWVSFASDGMDTDTDRKIAGNTQTDPFGPFLRLIGIYAREKKVLSPWEMAYRMTLLPAKRLNLKDRGKIAPGMAADLVIFKPETISDHPAAYGDQAERSIGVQWLVINGEVAVDGGKYTGARPGKVLRGSGKTPNK